MPELKAPSGKYRVVGTDRVDSTWWVHGDYDTVAEASAQADRLNARVYAREQMWVYDDVGAACINRSG